MKETYSKSCVDPEVCSAHLFCHYCHASATVLHGPLNRRIKRLHFYVLFAKRNSSNVLISTSTFFGLSCAESKLSSSAVNTHVLADICCSEVIHPATRAVKMLYGLLKAFVLTQSRWPCTSCSKNTNSVKYCKLSLFIACNWQSKLSFKNASVHEQHMYSGVRKYKIWRTIKHNVA